MTVSTNYSQPVIVNGYACWNCQQVAEAKKDINPASPAPDGAQAPGGVQASDRGAAVVFGGVLAKAAGTATPSAATAAGATPAPSPPGSLNILA